MIKLVNEPDYREVEVCKPLHHRRRRSPHGFLDHHLAHGHPYHECEKEKKEVRMKRSELRFDQKNGKGLHGFLQVCKVVPTVEEKSDEINVCHIEPEKVS